MNIMKKILAVDDDGVTREFYKALFSEAGFDVEVAPDAFTALEKYLEFSPDLLVLDMDMPGGGGKIFNLIRGILKLKKPVVFVTGFPEKAIPMVKGYAGVSVFQKPVSGEILVSNVRRLLGVDGTGGARTVL